MEQFLLPTQIEIIKEKDHHKATLIVAPCHPGYGTTVGNALRRVLLSSLPGAAATAVKIEGAEHEFSTIPHVKEDVVQIILNLKQLRVKVFTEDVVRLSLSADGEREVTAADIGPNSDVEIVNPNLHIAELTSSEAKLAMEIFVRQGRGYLPIEEREDEKKEIGVIAIDSVFTPVRSVGYRVEDMRVGQKTNYDKLSLTVETDGTIDPSSAIVLSTQMLLDHFNLLLNLEEGKKKRAKVAEPAPISAEQKLQSGEEPRPNLPQQISGGQAKAAEEKNAE